MADQQSDLKRLSLDKIIEAMTADLEGSPGHYAQFGGGSSASSAMPSWGEYPRAQVQHYLQHNGTPMAPYMPQEMPNYDPPPAEPIYYSPQTVNHLEINERNDLIGTIDVGNGNYINVIYGNASQIMMEQCPYNNPNLLEREYGLFGNKPQQVAQPQNGTGKQLIENLVGNWAPNQSGTYSPFGGASPDPQSVPEEVHKVEQQPQKKPRMVAEVKPMRPSYSDVLTKSVAAPVIPVPSAAIKPKQELAKKVLSKSSGKAKSKPAALKRQNSSGSDEHNSPKIHAPKKLVDKKSNLTARRWVSLDNLGTDNTSSSFETFEKKKPVGKTQKKPESLKTQKNVVQSKRPQTSCVNATTVNNFSQTVATDKVEKVTQAVPKVKKDKSKKVQNEKALKKGRAGRKRENRETVKNLYKTVSKHTTRWSKLALKVFYWLLHLICDVVSMSVNLVIQLFTFSGKCGWYHTILYTKYSWIYLASAFGKVRFLNAVGRQMDRWFGNSRFAFWRKFQPKASDKENANWIHGGLENNIALPSTGEEAMKRLLACKGKDPYSILGVTSTCSDDDIKKYYKRQAVLVHPDKNNQPGAEEAFKILVHAFDIIGEPERRQAFDQTRQVEAAWGELSDLLSQLHRKMEQAANTIRCTNCGLKHKRVPTQRPCYAARYCAQCKIRHSAKEGDIWAESQVMGFLWHYYACMEGAVYDVTEWAACQARNLKHLRANTHSVQYRIVLGQRPPAQTSVGKKKQSDSNASEADFEDFLNNLYNGKPGGTSTNGDQSAFRCDNRRRKTKRKK